MIKELSGAASNGRCDIWMDGGWLADGTRQAIDPASNGFWLGATVFDGARAFDGVAPDLDRHCARVVRSAEALGLNPGLTGAEIEALAREGIARFDPGAALYICPVFTGDCMSVITDSDDTRFLLMVRESPMPKVSGFSVCAVPQRRPARDMAPTDAKASCLYPNVVRGMRAAQARGFDQGVVMDPNGNVAEFSFSNLFMVKDGVVHTPADNGTFLNGITRQRVITLLRDDGVTVEERSIDYPELLSADEMFATGNFAKVKPCTRVEDHEMPIGEMTRRARDLYWSWAGRQNA
ncbi:MAG: branched-chain amino acid aminotransferase [Rhodospirillales bacterium]